MRIFTALACCVGWHHGSFVSSSLLRHRVSSGRVATYVKSETPNLGTTFTRAIRGANPYHSRLDNEVRQRPGTGGGGLALRAADAVGAAAQAAPRQGGRVQMTSAEFSRF